MNNSVELSSNLDPEPLKEWIENSTAHPVLTLSHLGGARIPPQWETFLTNSKTAQDIKMKFFKFNLTLMRVIFHIMTILISIRCYQPFVTKVSQDRKVKKLAYLPGYWLDLAEIWCRWVFLDSKSKMNKPFYTTSF